MSATWRKHIKATMKDNNDSWANLVSSTLTPAELDVAFADGYGRPEGESFTLWTTEYVYFPICYDGSEWAGSAPRNPNGKSLAHQGS